MPLIVYIDYTQEAVFTVKICLHTSDLIPKLCSSIFIDFRLPEDLSSSQVSYMFGGWSFPQTAQCLQLATIQTRNLNPFALHIVQLSRELQVRRNGPTA